MPKGADFLLMVFPGRNGPSNIQLPPEKEKTEVIFLIESILHGFLILTEINNNFPAFIQAYP